MGTFAQEREYLSVSEVARRLGVSAATVRRRVADGQIPAAQLGGPGSSVRIPATGLERWLEDHATTLGAQR